MGCECNLSNKEKTNETEIETTDKKEIEIEIENGLKNSKEDYILNSIFLQSAENFSSKKNK